MDLWSMSQNEILYFWKEGDVDLGFQEMKIVALWKDKGMKGIQFLEVIGLKKCRMS